MPKLTKKLCSRGSSHLTDLSFAKEDPWTNNVKQRELLLDEVVGSITGGTLKTSGLGTSLVSNTKGKRSERDREGKGHNRDSLRSGRPSSSNAKGERKNKTKPKQKTANISAPSSSNPRDLQLPAKITPPSNGKAQQLQLLLDMMIRQMLQMTPKCQTYLTSSCQEWMLTLVAG